jgi:hypothetical protein
MIKMTVSQNNAVDTVRGNAKVSVFTIRFGSGTLKSAAIYQITFPVNLKHMLGACYLFGCAERIKFNVHGCIIS